MPEDPTTPHIVAERTFIEKTIIAGGYVLSRRQLQVGPTTIRAYEPGEPLEPTPPPTDERREIGFWKRLMKAARRYGYDGI